MPEIRFSITASFDNTILKVCKELGIEKKEYIKSLIISDLREHKNGRKDNVK